jgi:hypothetical protein
METSIKEESLNPLLKERLFSSGNAERRRAELDWKVWVLVYEDRVIV